jgi:hypothetical protein
VDNDNPSIFIDRNTGGKSFRPLLPASLKVILHDDIFRNPNKVVTDEALLKWAAENGHIVITGDKATTRNPLFLKQLVESKAYCFVLYGLNGASPQGKAGCILASLDKIKELLASRPPPALWRIGIDNRTATRCDHEKTLQKMHSNRRL